MAQICKVAIVPHLPKKILYLVSYNYAYLSGPFLVFYIYKSCRIFIWGRGAKGYSNPIQNIKGLSLSNQFPPPASQAYDFWTS